MRASAAPRITFCFHICEQERKMADFEVMRQLAQPGNRRIILLVMDGLGGLGRDSDGKTELEAAHTPNLDRLAQQGTVGLSLPIGRGITPGSGPAHLALFGYDPVKYDVGRGVLSALGIGFELQTTDVAARGNFCTVDERGIITDRRAGRIPSEKGAELCQLLDQIEIEGAETFVRPVREYRFVLILRGLGLSPQLPDTDPQQVGLRPLPATAEVPEAQRTAELVNDWLAQARSKLAGLHPANMVTLRGFAQDPSLPKFQEIYKLNPAAVAVYPMYRGVARLVGMEVIPAEHPISNEFETVATNWERHDFFFVHVKYTDSRGEDGDFDGKKAVIEETDAALPILLDLKPDVLIVTGDHSTPSQLQSHSWHPVPTLIRAPGSVRSDAASAFGETECSRGGLGILNATDLMPLGLAHAGRLAKYGA
jgi:2,3-bisphosphoglycerate-independent phosphoglycerate mutase